MKSKQDGVIVLDADDSGNTEPVKHSKLKASPTDTSDLQTTHTNPQPQAESNSIDISRGPENSLPDNEHSASAEDSIDPIEQESNAEIEGSAGKPKTPPTPKKTSKSGKAKNVKAKAKPKPKKTPKKQTFDIEGSTEVTNIQLLAKSLTFQIFYYALSALTLGLLLLVNKWSNNKLYCWLCFKQCSRLDDADYVALNDVFGFFIVTPLAYKQVFISKDRELETHVFEHNYRSFFYEEASGKFKNLSEVAEAEICDNFAKCYKSARLEEEVSALRDTFGLNRLQPNLKSFRSLVLDSVLTPLVFFVGLCLVLLSLNGQFWYLCLLLALFLVVLGLNVLEKYLAETKLLESINFAEKVMVVRKTNDGVFKKKIIDSSELVIGDLVEITNNLRVPADMVLTHGACIIRDDFNRESTRSSTRVALDSMGIDHPRSLKCSLLAGNQVLYTLNQINEGCFAIVLRTGFNCKRAERLKQIINNQIRQKQDSWQVALLASLLAISLLYPLGLLLWSKVFNNGAKISQHHAISQLTDLVLVLLKPIVPLLLLIVLKLSTLRLSQQKVTVNSKEKLQETGRLRDIIFENRLLLAEEKTTAGYVLSLPVEQGRPVFDKVNPSSKKLFKAAENNESARRFCEVAGLCNLVFKVGNEYYGSETEKELLAESAFNLTNYNSKDSGCGRVFMPKLEVIKCFSKEYTISRFLASSRTDSHKVQSVLAKNSDGENLVLTKGEPKSIEHLFNEQTLPANFHSRIAKFANKGFKCLAFGYKKVTEEQVNSLDDQIEQGLTFAGFYLFKFVAPENITEVTRSLMGNNIQISLMTSGSIFSGIATARNNEIIAADKKVILLQTEKVDGTERFVVTLIEPKIGTVSIEESAVIGEKLNIVTLNDSNGTDVLQTADAIAITGNAFDLLQQKDAQEQLNAVLEKCRVYGDLTDNNRAQIIKLLREKSEDRPIGYVYEDMGCESVIREATVSINLRASSLSSYSTFASASSDLTQVVEIIKEGRATHANLSQAIYFSAFFIALQFVGFAILWIKETTFARSQLLFLDFFILVGFGLFQANLKPTDLTSETPSRGIWNNQLAVKLLTTFLVATGFLITINWLLYKTKFYIAPSVMAANTKDKSPEAFFYYDPFTMFITLVLLNIFFVFHAHRNNRFVKSFFNKVGLIVYWTCALLFSLYVLFIYHFSTKWIVNQKLIKAFRIPGLFHFEIIILFFLPLIYGGFNFARYLEERILGKRSRNSKKEEEEEEEVEDAEPSVKKRRKAPLIVERDEESDNSVNEKSVKKGSKKTVAKAKVVAKKISQRSGK